MSRFAGLPCSKSSDQDRPIATLLVPSVRFNARRLIRAAASGTLGVALPFALGASSILPVAQSTAASATAATFAATGLVGASGDVALAAASPDLDRVLSGTLAFGDPSDPPPPSLENGAELPILPPAPAPGSETPAPSEPTPAPAPTEPPAPVAAPPVEDAPDAPAEDPEARIAARGVKASSIARRLVGSAYRYGAAGPRAFDCSGLTLYVYRQLGISLPHKARAQFSERYGRRIKSMNSLMPGDLVFFANTAGPGISHVALYVGDGMMVSANTPRQGVRLTSIHAAYWRSHWAGGLRLM